MALAAWFRALHIRERYIRAQLLWQSDAQERLHRLEIRVRDLADLVDHLEQRLDRQRSRANGAKGGRPSGDPPKDLADIPLGDKAALRRRLGVVPGRPFQHPQE